MKKPAWEKRSRPTAKRETPDRDAAKPIVNEKARRSPRGDMGADARRGALPKAEKVRGNGRALRSRRRIAAGLALCGLALAAVQVSGVFQASNSASHGEARLFFSPWIAESDALARIHRAGGVAIAEPGEAAGRAGVFRAIAASADFLPRIRSEGAILVVFN